MTGVHEDPWWASGSGPQEGLREDEDPISAHTSARRGRRGGHAGAWWQDAVDALAEAARAAGDGSRAADPAAPPHVHDEGRDVCHVCPICVGLRALDESRPEVVAHLSEALRHLSLAARAFIEAQVAATGGVDDGLHRVDLDDE